MRQLISILTALLLTTGCDVFKKEERSNHRKKFEGSLTEQSQKLQKHKHAGECDRKYSKKQSQIAKDLDSRKKEIEQVAKSLPADDRFKVVALGPTFMRELKDPSSLPPNEGPYEYTKSWEIVYNRYQEIKNTETDQNWVRFDSYVRFLISDDESRIANYENMYLDKDSGPDIEESLKIVAACDENSSCTALELNWNQWLFLYNNPYYKWFVYHLDHEKVSSKKRELIKDFRERLEFDATGYAFRISENVKRTSATELELAIDPTAFVDAKEQLAQYIESVWSSSDLKLKMIWVSKSAMPNVFQILLGEEVGGRSYVAWSKQIVMLFPNIDVRTIPHEIGHVLGFKDRYFTVWHPETCEYVVQGNDADLMSDHSTGSVTADEWEILKAKYPL